MICCICDQEIEVVGTWKEGHNAQPVVDGRCCGKCNDSIVVPTRLWLAVGTGTTDWRYKKGHDWRFIPATESRRGK